MKKLNKKGFTLIELLAVIVVLAIIMVIAATQVGKAINNARKGSFESSYKMIVKEVKNRILQSDVNVSTTIACDDNGSPKCSAIYDISENDYEMSITDSSGKYIISISGKGKFDGLDLNSIASNISNKASVVSGGSAIAMAIDSAGKEVDLTPVEIGQFLTKEQKDNITLISNLNLDNMTGVPGNYTAKASVCPADAATIKYYASEDIVKIINLLKSDDKQIYFDKINSLDNLSIENNCYGALDNYPNIYRCYDSNGNLLAIKESSTLCIYP